MLKRKQSRENAFILIFEKIFNDLPADDILDQAVNFREFETDTYCEEVFRGVYENVGEIDALISENAKGWTIDRISRVALAVLRLAIYEINYRDDIPVSVSVNEAVELCKKYAAAEDASFVNGILGTIADGKEGK